MDVNILDSTGRQPYKGDVLIKGTHIVSVGKKLSPVDLTGARIFEGKGRTLMSGMGTYVTYQLLSSIALTVDSPKLTPTLTLRGPMLAHSMALMLWRSRSIQFIYHL